MKIQKRILKDQLSNWWYFAAVVILVLAIGLVASRLIQPAAAYESSDFVFTVKTDNPGSSNDSQFTIPTDNGYAYNYAVDCDADGVIDHTAQTGDVTCSYPSPGTYTVAISGTFPKIMFNNQGDKLKIINLDQWGDIVWENAAFAFYGAENMKSTATDSPDLSNVTNVYQMFFEAKSFNGDVADWDVSNITIMSMMFTNAVAFDSDLSSWTTSSAEDMTYMFAGAGSFRGGVSTWDTSNVLYMPYMFEYTKVFNDDLSGWDTSNVTDMSGMFEYTDSFSGDVSTWDVSNVESMEKMFLQANAFDGDLSKWTPVSLNNAETMLDGSGMGRVSYNNLLEAWSQIPNLPDDIIFGAKGVMYSNTEAHQKIIDEHNWTFVNDIYGTYDFNPLPVPDDGDGSSGGTTNPGNGDGGATNPSGGSSSSGGGTIGSGTSSGSGATNPAGGSSGDNSGSATPGSGSGSGSDGVKHGSGTGGDSENSGNESEPASRPMLIKHGWDSPSVTFAASHAKEMEKMPFDGVTMMLDDPDLRDKIFSSQPLDYNEIYNAMSAVKDTKFTSMKHNFIMLYITPVGDLDSDAAWSVASDNIAKFAKAAKASGFEGIAFDDEAYWGPVVEYGEDCSDVTYTVNQCRVLAHQRGKQIMDAMRSEWSDVALLAFHGPTVSDPRTVPFYRSQGLEMIDLAPYNQIIGAFGVGMVQSTIDTDAKYANGGEIYMARSDQNFDAIKYWVKQGFPANSDYVPSSMKSKWAENVSASFGLYDESGDLYDDVDMNPAIWKDTIVNAMQYADDYVWAYTETYDWWGAPVMWYPQPETPVPSAWIDATRQAMNSFK